MVTSPFHLVTSPWKEVGVHACAGPEGCSLARSLAGPAAGRGSERKESTGRARERMRERGSSRLGWVGRQSRIRSRSFEAEPGSEYARVSHLGRFGTGPNLPTNAGGGSEKGSGCDCSLSGPTEFVILYGEKGFEAARCVLSYPVSQRTSKLLQPLLASWPGMGSKERSCLHAWLNAEEEGGRMSGRKG